MEVLRVFAFLQAGQVETSGDILVLMGTAPVHYSTLLHDLV